MSESPDQELRTLRALYWSPRDPEGRGFASLAEAYRRRGDLDEANALVRDGLGRLPDFATGHLVAARVARDREGQAAAQEHLERVLSLDPENVTALVERAGDQIAAGDREGAARDIDLVLALEPGHPEALSRLHELEGTGEEAGRDGFEVGVEGDEAELSLEALEAEFSLDGEASSVEETGFEVGADGTAPEVEETGLEAIALGDAGLGEVELGVGGLDERVLDDAEVDDAGLEEIESESGFGSPSLLENDLEVSSLDGVELDEAVPNASEDDPFADIALEGTQDGGAGEVASGPSQKPAFVVEPEEAPQAEQAGLDRSLFTRTMGDLYARQGLLARAIEVFEHLVEKDPHNPRLAERLDELRVQASETPTSDGGASVDSGNSGEGLSVAMAAGEDFSSEFLGAPGEERSIEDIQPEEPISEAFSEFAGNEPDAEGEAAFDEAAFDEAPFDEMMVGDEEVTPEPLQEESDAAALLSDDSRPEAGRTAASYLNDLLAWQPGAVPIESLAPNDGRDAGEGDAEDAPKPGATEAVGEGSEPASNDDDLERFNAWLDGFGK